MKKPVLVLALFAISTLPCLAADSPFAGTWKLNTAKSTFTGDTFTYTTTATGLHYSDGAVAFDFAADGKPHPTMGNATTTWTKVDDHTWDSVRMVGDKVAGKAHRVLSADGKTLTITYTEIRPDGSTDEGSSVYNRVLGGPGLAGKWKNVKAVVPPSTLTIAVPSAGQIDFEDPDFKVSIVGPTDGTQIAVKGPTVPDGFTVGYKPAGANKLEYTNKLNDKVVGVGAMSVSGNTLTDVSWIPGKEGEKSTAVYDRQ